MRPELALREHNHKYRRQIFMALGSLSASLLLVAVVAFSSLSSNFSAQVLFLLGCLPAICSALGTKIVGDLFWIRRERIKFANSGLPAQRDAIEKALEESRARGRSNLDKYIVGFEVKSGVPLWISDENLSKHICVISKDGTAKTKLFEALMLQQMARGRASGFTYIDSDPSSETLTHIVLMALFTGRIEDLIVIDYLNPVHSYNFILTNQKVDIKARKILQAGQSLALEKSQNTQDYQVASDYVYRLVRAMESLGLSWSVADISAALSTYQLASTELQRLLNQTGAKQASAELAQLEAFYKVSKASGKAKNFKSSLDQISRDLGAILEKNGSYEQYSDLVLSDAISRGKMIYFRGAKQSDNGDSFELKIFRDDFETALKEIRSHPESKPEDPHLIFIDDDASVISSLWTGLLDLAKQGQSPILFGVKSEFDFASKSLRLKHDFIDQILSKVGSKVLIGVPENSSLAQAKGLLNQDTNQDGAELENFYEDLSPASIPSEPDDSLAWFDFGLDGLMMGAVLTVNSEVAQNWQARDYIPKFEKIEVEGLGLAKWIGKQK